MTAQGNGCMGIREIVSKKGRRNLPSIKTRFIPLLEEASKREEMAAILRKQLSSVKFGLTPLIFSEEKWGEFKKSYEWSGYTQEDIVKTIKYYYKEAIGYCEKPYPQGLRMWRFLPEMKNPVQKELMPLLKNLYIECGRIETEGRATLIIIALEHYKSKKGNYPEELSELEPDFLFPLPKDPFSENPFLYRKEGPRWILYSVGEDLRDDEGKRHIYLSEDGTGDIIFYSR